MRVGINGMGRVAQLAEQPADLELGGGESANARAFRFP